MRADLDTIQFETKEEVRAVLTIMDKWQTEQAAAKETETAKKLHDLLDIMLMSW